MTVGELIEKLQKMDNSLPVVYYYDGAPRGSVDFVVDKLLPSYVVLFDDFEITQKDWDKLEDIRVNVLKLEKW